MRTRSFVLLDLVSIPALAQAHYYRRPHTRRADLPAAASRVT
jgi:hypothetical protein